MVGFQIKPDKLAIFSKRDSLQYPFLEEIAAWAEGTENYEFATLFGPYAIGSPGVLVSMDQIKDSEKVLSRDFEHREMLQLLIAAAINKFGDAFKKSIFADMERSDTTWRISVWGTFRDQDESSSYRNMD